MWEPVNWDPFDIVATDAYRDASNTATFRAELREQLKHGKPLAVPGQLSRTPAGHGAERRGRTADERGRAETRGDGRARPVPVNGGIRPA